MIYDLCVKPFLYTLPLNERKMKCMVVVVKNLSVW